MTELIAVHESLLSAALHVLSAERGRVEDPHFSASLDYAYEQLEIAAADLASAVDLSDARHFHPVGWPEHSIASQAWVRVLVRHALTSAAPLDFEGARVPLLVRELIEEEMDVSRAAA